MAKKNNKYGYSDLVNDVMDNLSSMSISLHIDDIRSLLLENKVTDFRFISESRCIWRGIIISIER